MNEWSVEKLSRACSLAGWKSLVGGHVRPLSSGGDLWGCPGLGEAGPVCGDGWSLSLPGGACICLVP